MLSLQKPDRQCVERFLQSQATLDVSYVEVGASRGQPPHGYNVDRTQLLLGHGAAVFAAAKAALERWQHFQLGWVEAWPNDTKIEPGAVVAVLVRTYGFWWLNACRIVYVIDEQGPSVRFGFAYGTLPGHAEQGEERFSIEWNRADDSVTYTILAFSRPRHLLAKLGYPIVRRLQKQFGPASAAAMLSCAGEVEPGAQ